MMHGRHTAAYFLATLSVSMGIQNATDAAQTTLACPQSIPAATLTMACDAACPNALSPCLYFAAASDCVAEEASGSVCVASTLPNANCAIECFSPISGSGGDAWNLLITDAGEYKLDVAAREAHDASFRLAKKQTAQLAAIRDLTFPATVQTISISGNALPILDKAVDYPVVFHGFSVDIDMGNFSYLAAATDATTILMENVNLTALATFPLLPKLTTLQLANGKLRAIPQGIAALPSLQRLDVSLNTLVTIDAGLVPTGLIDLCLQDCALETFPPGIVNMTSLRKLDLSGNKFALPAAGSLPLQVEHLIWWGFYHKRLPPDFPNMTQLKKLEMGWNDFSDASALALLPMSLEELHLIDVLLTELPTSFASLDKLTWIEAGKNNLKAVTKGTLPPNLTFLNLSINVITSIDAGALPTCLTTLDLRVNSLDCDSLPTDFASLASLTTLYLHANLLSCVPPAIFRLAKLETLTLHQNPNLTRVTFNESELAFLGNLKSFIVDQKCLETSCDSPAMIGSSGYKVCLTGDKTTTDTSSSSGSGKGSTASTGSDTSSAADNRNLIIGLATAIGGLVAILIGAVHWKRRRDAAQGVVVMQHPGDDPKSGRCRGAGGVDDDHYHADGASDATAYAEMTSGGEAHSSKTSKSTVAYSEAEVAGAKKIKIIKKTTTTTTTTTTSGSNHACSAAVVVESSSSSTRSAESVDVGRYSIWDDQELLQCRVDFAAIRDVQPLSSGMFGEVWLAIYMSRHVAVKRLKKNPSGRGGAPVALDSSASSSRGRVEIHQFIQEIKLHSRMDHPKIVAFIGVAWTMENDVQAVVEYMPQGDLRSFLSSLQPKIESLDDDDGDSDSGNDHHWDDTALLIAIDVAEALVYLHSLDPPVLHRDLKSRNVLLDESLRAKVTDFGVSRYHFDDDTHVQLTTGLGTARWSAPELLTGSDANYTSAIDMYSLGVVLSELDTWAMPFVEHVGVTESALLSHVCAGELQPRFRAHSPREIVLFAKKCLAIDPTQRPTAVEAAYTLRQCLAKLQASADPHARGLAAAGRSSTSSSQASTMAIGFAMSL